MEVKANDIQYAIEINFWLFKILGIWPLSSQSSITEKFFTYFIILLCSLLLAFIIIPGSLLTYVKVQDPALRIKLSGALSFCVMAILKYILFVLGQKNIAKCVKYLKSDWYNVASSRDRDIMINHAQFGRYGSVICAIFMYGGGLFYAGILPSVTTRVIANTTIRPLAYPSYYVWFDPQEDVTLYKMIFSIHCCCAFIMHSITSASCGFAVTFVMHACGQLEILIVWLNDLVNQTHSHQEFDRKFGDIISHHVKTLQFIVNIEAVLCEICLVEFIGCTLNICFLGYYLMLEWEQSDAIGIMTYTILLISFTFNIFLFCFIGEMLTEKCEKIGEAAYTLSWYDIKEKQALGVILIILNAQIPVAITAGKLVNLSLRSFCTVIRSAMTYLNLLRTFTL
uniref:Odorant receptor n=1 Tax=Aulacocentrum confusum TaxID=2767324 RepID=A0A7G8Z942_9HYME|nr:olfactory receptor 23 [Aulacocentrum confusum]